MNSYAASRNYSALESDKVYKHTYVVCGMYTDAVIDTRMGGGGGGGK